MNLLLPLAGPFVAGGMPGKDAAATGDKTPFATAPHARLDTDTHVPGIGFKAARLGAAARAGLPVLPGWVVPVGLGKSAMGAGVDAIRANGVGAGRVAVLGQSLDTALAAELRGVVDVLGGRVIVRSSSQLEGDARWAGAFSSVTGVGPDDVASAVRSCWASAFAIDPLRRAEECGLELEALELAVLVQPEIVPEAGGVAWVRADGVIVEGVLGHPGALLAGWAEAEALDAGVVANVEALAGRVYAELGDELIEWAACDGEVWLLQAWQSAPENREEPAMPMPVGGLRVAGRPGVPGMAAGPLVAGRPHQTMASDCRGAIVLVDRSVPALAPLLFGARGVISQAGAASSHLAEVARSLGVPMVTGCRAETVTGPSPAPGAWFATINGATGEVVLAPA
jgi:phosphoenolpyruvate synthase/pyruvate phosphate dikinase